MHEYRYVLILGTLAEIRQYVYEHRKPQRSPSYHFERDRQHWHLANAHDDGWRLDGGWPVALDRDDPQLVGPDDFWPSSEVPVLSITAACRLSNPTAQLFWKTLADNHFTEEKSVRIALTADGRDHTYRVALRDSPTYRGSITGLRLDPAPTAANGDSFILRSIRRAD